MIGGRERDSECLVLLYYRILFATLGTRSGAVHLSGFTRVGDNPTSPTSIGAALKKSTGRLIILT